MRRTAEQAVPPISEIPFSEMSAYPLPLASRISGLTIWALRSAIWSGKLTARLGGKRLIILRGDLEKYLASLPPVLHGRNFGKG